MTKIQKLIIINITLLLLIKLIPNTYNNEVFETSEEQQTTIETTIAQEETEEEQIVVAENKTEKNITLTTDTDLRQLSNLSAEDYDRILAGTNLVGIGNALVEIEQEYQINGLYMLGLAHLESDRGLSPIALNKNNITGYRVYDSNPSAGSTFESFDECLKVTARLLNNYYLKQGAKYYAGTTAKSIDTHYCTDKQHADKIVSRVNNCLKKY